MERCCGHDKCLADYIEQMNKPVEKNKAEVQVKMVGGSAFQEDKPQGEKWKLEKPKKKKQIAYKPGTLPEKRSLSDLP